MPQFGDEHMQAAGVEEAVVSPEVEQYILGVDHLVTVLAKTFQYRGGRVPLPYPRQVKSGCCLQKQVVE